MGEEFEARKLNDSQDYEKLRERNGGQKMTIEGTVIIFPCPRNNPENIGR
jgi:hypothetical protein